MPAMSDESVKVCTLRKYRGRGPLLRRHCV